MRIDVSKSYFILYGALLLYSISGVCSKFAANNVFLSFGFLSLYGLAIVILGVYAILWQQVLKFIPLINAYLNKSIVIILGMLWGFFCFGEKIKWNMILGASVIIIGIFMVVNTNE